MRIFNIFLWILSNKYLDISWSHFSSVKQGLPESSHVVTISPGMLKKQSQQYTTDVAEHLWHNFTAAVPWVRQHGLRGAPKTEHPTVPDAFLRAETESSQKQQWGRNDSSSEFSEYNLSLIGGIASSSCCDSGDRRLRITSLWQLWAKRLLEAKASL